ncbi:MAG: WbqC family protein [Bdellovibrionota bacterium]
MRIAVMQPYFLPYLGYFALIGRVDTFVVFDHVQYIRRGWVNRNRLPSPDGKEWSYFGIPVRKCHQDTPINEVEISYEDDWQGKLRKTIDQHYAHAPCVDAVTPLLTPLWDKHERLLDLLEPLLRNFSTHLGFTPKWIRSSELVAGAPELAQTHAQELILGICSKLGAKEYWNLPGGRDLYQSEPFTNRGIDLRFLSMIAEPGTRFPGFETYSILDQAMRFEPARLREMAEAIFPGSS